MHGQFGIPGQTAALYSETNEFIWGGDASRIEILSLGIVVDGAARDAGSTPTTFLRPGLMMGKVTATGKHLQFDPTATDGTQHLAGILANELVAIDRFSNDVDRMAPAVVRAPVKAANLYVLGTALQSSDYEYYARAELARVGCVLDDDIQGFLSGVTQRIATKITDYTVVAADQGTLFQAKTADVTFTLPAIKLGLKFTFQQTANNEMVVASAEGDNMVVGNDASADSITFTTDAEQIGAQVQVEAKYFDGTLKWIATLPHVPFGTGTATMTYGIAT